MYALRRREAFERLVVRTSYFPKRGLSTAKRRTLYDTLGVASTASDEEIRQAFRNRAKELHPDIASAVDPSAFVELLTAREVLGCADRRARYDLLLSSSAFAGFAAAEDDRRRRDATGQHFQDGDEGEMGQRVREKEQQEPLGKEERARQQQRMNHLPAWTTSNESITGTAWEAELRKDLWEALGNAYLGPPLHADVGRRFPEHFETELRGSPEHPDLMHIVSGRIQLGVVRQREAARALAHHAPLGSVDSRRRRGDDDRGASCSRGSHDDDSRSSSRLELLYGDCGLLMESHENHTIDPRTGAYASCLEMHAGGRLAYRCLGELSGRLGQRVHLMDNSNRVTHVGVCGSAPLVTHLSWYSVLTRRCVWRSRRAWLPDAHYWLFPPRLPSHNIGGWYFEEFRCGRDRDDDANMEPAHPGDHLPASVPILAAAHLSLAFERAQPRKAAATTTAAEDEPLTARWSAEMQRWWPRKST